jgi:hypothetical protein
MGVAGFRTAAERTSADDGPAACSFVHLHETTRKPMRQLLKNTFTLALALVFTAGMAFGQSNEATVNQVGNSHSADIQQDGVGNITDLEQADQNLNDNATNAMSADVFQKFKNNEAYIDQKGSQDQGAATATASADVDQIGNNNFLRLESGPFFANSHDVDVDQLGNNNTVRLQGQNGGGEATVFMDGNRNKLVEATQGGLIKSNNPFIQKNSQFLEVRVNGSGNVIGGDQESGDGGDRLTVNVDGDDNFIPTSQVNAGPGAGNADRDIDIDVLGSENFIKALQGGAGNTATIDLNSFSDNNQVVVDQQTAGNTATVTVDGMDNTTTVCQASSCN